VQCFQHFERAYLAPARCRMQEVRLHPEDFHLGKRGGFNRKGCFACESIRRAPECRCTVLL
jgi:hypothetical protein